MTRNGAKKMAGQLTAEAQRMIRCWAERKSGTFSTRAMREVIAHGLIEKTTNLLTGKEVWVLTATGKKVAKELATRG